MRFDKLDETIPRVPADRKSLHKNTIYVSGGFGWSVRVKYPGKHGSSAGDFVVEVLSEGVWDDYHQFKHADLFADVQEKAAVLPITINTGWLEQLLAAVDGETAPTKLYPLDCDLPGVHLDALTNAMQALAVCEYRRYPSGDQRGGGRYLPTNYMLAILQGFWTPDEASKLMRVGFPALRKLNGFTPYTASDNPRSYITNIHLPRVEEASHALA